MQFEQPEPLVADTTDMLQPQPIIDEPTGLNRPKNSRRQKLLIAILVIAALTIAGIIAITVWYNRQLTPLSTDKDAKISVKIVEGSTSSQIGKLLEDNKIIRDARVFNVYARLSNTRDKLQAGSYKLSPSSSTPEIIQYLVDGRVDQFTVTFLPGATVADAREVLLKAGYSAAQVDAGLAKKYDHPIFATKPASADLEGYIYGETYAFPVGVTVEQILTNTFDEFYSFVQANSLQTAYQSHGLTLFEGITLASIIQREVNGEADQKQAAQVFYKRLGEDMPLGSDATFIYIAKKLGVTPSVDLDSPYNTRIYGGITPGPISTPSKTALLAVAQPAEGDYLYFINGDDGVNYFARTLAEHEQNVVDRCAVNCSLF